ncbi:MAG: GFA family protein [Polyangiaceae bacterium]
MVDRSVNGSCLCNAVRFELELPTRFCAHCHCSLCRRAHGAAFVTWVGVPNSQLRILEGDHALRRYASSAPARRSFCGQCGSMLFFESERWPAETHIVRAAIQGDIDQAPAAHVYWDDRATWMLLHDDLPKLGGVTGVEPLAVG